MFFTIVDSTNDLLPCLKILATSSAPKLTSIHFTSSRNMWYCYLIIEPFTVSLSLFSDLLRYDNYPSLQDIFITCEYDNWLWWLVDYVSYEGDNYQVCAVDSSSYYVKCDVTNSTIVHTVRPVSSCSHYQNYKECLEYTDCFIYDGQVYSFIENPNNKLNDAVVKVMNDSLFLL